MDQLEKKKISIFSIFESGSKPDGDRPYFSVITRNAFQSRPLSFGLSHSLSLFGPGVKENGLFYRFDSDLEIFQKMIRLTYVPMPYVFMPYISWSGNLPRLCHDDQKLVA